MQRPLATALVTFALLLCLVPLLAACGANSPGQATVSASPTPLATVTDAGNCSATDAKAVSDQLRPVLYQVEEVKRKAAAAYDAGPSIAMGEFGKMRDQVPALTLPACGEQSRQLALAMIESYWQNYREASYYGPWPNKPSPPPDVYKWEDADQLKAEFTAELVRIERALPAGVALYTPPTPTPDPARACDWEAEVFAFLDVDGDGRMNGAAEIPLAGVEVAVEDYNSPGSSRIYTTNDRGIAKATSLPRDCRTAAKTRRVEIWGLSAYRATTPGKVVVRDGEQVRFGVVMK